MPQYQWMIGERNGPEQIELATLSARRFATPVNRPEETSAEISASDSAAFARLLRSGTSEMFIYRDGIAIDTVFQLTNVVPTANNGNLTYALTWLGGLSYLQHMTAYAGTVYTTTAQSRIGFGLVNAFQARPGGNYGITDFGAPVTDPLRNVTFDEDHDVLDALVVLSELDTGFDFTLDAARRLRFHYPRRGTDRTDLVFEWKSNVTGFEGFDFDTSPGQIITDTRVTGGPGSGLPVTSTDADAQALYGRREASVQYSDVSSSTTILQGLSDGIIADRSHPQVVPSITLSQNSATTPYGSYVVGDTVTVVIQEGLIDVNDAYRIVNIDVTIDANNNEIIKLDLNET